MPLPCSRVWWTQSLWSLIVGSVLFTWMICLSSQTHWKNTLITSIKCCRNWPNRSYTLSQQSVFSVPSLWILLDMLWVVELSIQCLPRSTLSKTGLFQNMFGMFVSSLAWPCTTIDMLKVLLRLLLLFWTFWRNPIWSFIQRSVAQLYGMLHANWPSKHSKMLSHLLQFWCSQTTMYHS